MALNSLLCADVLKRNYSLTQLEYCSTIVVLKKGHKTSLLLFHDGNTANSPVLHCKYKHAT